MTTHALAKLIFLAACWCGALGFTSCNAVAQTGGMIQTGSGQPGELFKLWKLSCAIKGDTAGSPTAEQAGGRWRPIGGESWHDSDDKVFLPPGIYEIEFKPKIPNWTKPQNKTVKLNGNTREEGVYHRKRSSAEPGDRDPKTVREPARR